MMLHGGKRTSFSLLSKFTLVALMITSVIAVVLALGLGRFLQKSIIDHEADRANSEVKSVLDPELRQEDFSGPLSAARYSQIDQQINRYVYSDHVVRVKLWNRDGRLVYSDEPALIGQSYPLEADLNEALSGEVESEISSLDKEENASERERFDRLLEIYAPIQPAGSPDVVGAYEIYYELSAVDQQIADVRTFIGIAVAAGFTALFLTLFGLVRNASQQLLRRNRENRELFETLERSYLETVTSLANAVEAKDTYTKNHAQMVSEMAIALGKELRLNEQQLDDLRYGSMLHDVGKIGIPDSVLNKPGKLNEGEWALMKTHSAIGARILEPVPKLAGAANIVMHHHERFDGGGYPDGLPGEEIPIGARILAVVDSWSAIIDKRPYKEPRAHEDAIRELQRCSGSQFDPSVVVAFVSLFDRGVLIGDTTHRHAA